MIRDRCRRRASTSSIRNSAALSSTAACRLPSAGPLLIIAGAGSGKTNTLAHRVAHLIVNGADPRRIMLLTFSRRAAAEMTRRVERILADGRARPTRRRVDRRDRLGRHLPLRSARGCCANTPTTSGSIAPSPSTTARISADLMNLVRHELGFSKTEKRLPGQRHLPRDLFARGQQRDAARRGARRVLSLVRGLARRAAALFAHYVEAKQAQNVLDYDDLLLYWAHMMQEPSIARDVSRPASIMCWSTNIRTPTGCRPRSCWRCKPNGQGLTVVGDDAQSIYSFRAATVRNILDFPGHFTPRGRGHHAGAELSLDAADPRGRQRA